jgi:rhodanese-related sulfurtransferase
MAQVAERVEELKKFDKVIVMCQSGKRAEALVNFLETEYGLVNLIQMDGGILGWKEKVDATLKFD